VKTGTNDNAVILSTDGNNLGPVRGLKQLQQNNSAGYDFPVTF
jgi:hypothetical protein